jgi:hypothetical protein
MCPAMHIYSYSELHRNLVGLCSDSRSSRDKTDDGEGGADRVDGTNDNNGCAEICNCTCSCVGVCMNELHSVMHSTKMSGWSIADSQNA